MAKLTTHEKAFVEKRARFVRNWPVVGTAALIVVCGLAVWLWFSTPLLINPWAVISGLRTESIPESTLSLMAAMLPVVSVACLFVLVVVLLLSFAAFSNEKKLITVIERLTSSRNNQSGEYTEE